MDTVNAKSGAAPFFAVDRLRMGSDGRGITTLVGFAGGTGAVPELIVWVLRTVPSQSLKVAVTAETFVTISFCVERLKVKVYVPLEVA